jgi:uncharacterized protein YecE (DUF72 family)
MDWRLGTMGFSYADWAGAFYPKGTKPGDYLSYYAKHFDAVELDTTFHAIPPIERVRIWAEVTPEKFRFCPKTFKGVTHDPDVALDGAVGAMHDFLEVMRALGPKLGVVLIQFPPSFAAREAPSLRRFVRALPDEIRFAVEFRHDSWFVESTVDLLRSLNVCWAAADYAHEPRQLHVTSDFLYIRWIGQHRQFPSMDRERVDVSERLVKWKEQTEGAVAAWPQLTTAWGFFNNDFAGNAVATCRRFKRLLGLPVREAEDSRQGQLFDDVDG